MIKTHQNYIIIMAGGVGSRFWPLSRENSPKQFHDLLHTGQSLFQQTIKRFEGICPPENIFVVTHKDYKSFVQEQAPFLKDEQILLEPHRRNTAPCIAYGVYKIASRDPDANIVVTPADHIILKEQEFKKVITTCLNHTAKKDVLITLGIKPSRPDTGYGYIQYESKEVNIFKKIFQHSPIRKVKTFAEKPPLELAIEFLRSGDFLWNAGIFIWNAKTILKEFEKHLPETAEAFSEIQQSFFTNNEEKALEIAYPQCKNISIDYGIMEKAENVYILPTDLGWSDLGTWKSLYEFSQKDENKNVVIANNLLYETTNSIIMAPNNKLVVVQGLENYIVVEQDNVLMICHKDQEQRVREFVAQAKKKGQEFV